jgi:hypothetical protein
VVAFPQKGLHQRADSGHAGREADGRHALLHLRDLFLKGGNRGIALPAITVSRLLALEDFGKLARIAITVGHGCMNRLVERTMFDRLLAVAVENGGGETVFPGVSHMKLVLLSSARRRNKKTRSAYAKTGRRYDGISNIPF